MLSVVRALMLRRHNVASTRKKGRKREREREKTTSLANASESIRTTESHNQPTYRVRQCPSPCLFVQFTISLAVVVSLTFIALRHLKSIPV